MENPVNSSTPITTLEKVKLQEQEKEAKLKEKREQENTISFLSKAIRDATTQAEKSEKVQENLVKSTDSLHEQKVLAECRRDTLLAQLSSFQKKLKELRAKSEEEISKVWEMRSSFCKEIHSVSDACDVWTLLTKPVGAEPASRSVPKEVQMPSQESEKRLQAAIERRIKVLAERDRLSTEPENGEEFMRIRNALHYSLDKIAEELNK
ncbi:uncharacterized protein LOC123871624 [Maniola jurtina]|uniref:uncharacterized protein LOC123871624 n=1 Tax=Maniola jurtina TaxID=191418 RepID=UPI001E68B0A9|nr:uncharacterized protein LOC123871624 [Maniola jurtina]